MLPGWLLIRPPRPERTSFGFRVEMRPPCPGGTITRGGGIDPPLARGMIINCVFPVQLLRNRRLISNVVQNYLLVCCVMSNFLAQFVGY